MTPQELIAKLRDDTGKHIGGLYDKQAADAIEGLLYPPLTLEEVRKLSAMQSGAPWTDDLLQALAECVKLYEQCRDAGIRPFDPADLDQRQHDDFWEHGTLPGYTPTI